jgi:hypothetical protein
MLETAVVSGEKGEWAAALEWVVAKAAVAPVLYEEAASAVAQLRSDCTAIDSTVILVASCSAFAFETS